MQRTHKEKIVRPQSVLGETNRGLLSTFFPAKTMNYKFKCGECGKNNCGVLSTEVAEHIERCDSCGVKNRFYVREKE